MQITKNSVVSLTYTLKENNAQGNIIEVADEANPLVWLYGVGMMLPKFEENLADKKAGDDFEFTLESQHAYGVQDPNAIVELSKDIFTFEGKLDEELIAIGNLIPMRDGEGNMLQGKVAGHTETGIMMDFNHPMAGKTLNFSGKILDVREATDEEISHGHVHGAGGHHH